jgi:hypothetical protein
MLDFLGYIATATIMVLAVNAMLTFMDMPRSAKLFLAAVAGLWIGVCAGAAVAGWLAIARPFAVIGIFVATPLVAAAIAAVVSATVVSRFWQAGTIMATAMTPVIVAVVKEMIERPARRVSSLATRAGAPPVARAARRVVEPPPEAQAPPPPVGPSPEYTEMRVYGRERANTGRRWKLAVLTGLLACVIAIAAMTLPELVAGRSVVSSSHHTTIFGGHRSTSSTTKQKTTSTDEKSNSTSTEQQNSTSTEQQPQDTTTTAPDQTTTQAPPAGQQPAPLTQTQPPAATQTQPPAQTQSTAPAPQPTP